MITNEKIEKVRREYQKKMEMLLTSLNQARRKKIRILTKVRGRMLSGQEGKFITDERE